MKKIIHLSLGEYAKGKKIPKPISHIEIIKNQVNREAEVLVTLPPPPEVPSLQYFLSISRITPRTESRLFGFLSSILP